MYHLLLYSKTNFDHKIDPYGPCVCKNNNRDYSPNITRPVALCNVSRAVGSGFVILCIYFMLQSADVALPCQYDNYATL